LIGGEERGLVIEDTDAKESNAWTIKYRIPQRNPAAPKRTISLAKVQIVDGELNFAWLPGASNNPPAVVILQTCALKLSWKQQQTHYLALKQPDKALPFVLQLKEAEGSLKIFEPDNIKSYYSSISISTFPDPQIDPKKLYFVLHPLKAPFPKTDPEADYKITAGNSLDVPFLGEFSDVHLAFQWKYEGRGRKVFTLFGDGYVDFNNLLPNFPANSNYLRQREIDSVKKNYEKSKKINPLTVETLKKISKLAADIKSQNYIHYSLFVNYEETQVELYNSELSIESGKETSNSEMSKDAGGKDNNDEQE
jgi:hypothetical protein